MQPRSCSLDESCQEIFFTSNIATGTFVLLFHNYTYKRRLNPDPKKTFEAFAVLDNI